MTNEIGIIKAVLNGDIESFRQLVQLYEKPVNRMIRNFVNDHHASEDIAQDVFFTAYKKLGSFDPARSNFSTWLLTITKNKSINAIKKKQPLVIDNLPEDSDKRDSSCHFNEKDFYNQLDEALQNLPVKQKAAFVLAEFENLPYEQIAQIEGTKTGTIKSRINRAKEKLRKALKNFEGNNE